MTRLSTPSLAEALGARFGAPLPPLDRDGSNRMLIEARRLAALGIPVIPCDHKTPTTTAGLAAATTDHQTIDRWFRRPFDYGSNPDLVYANPDVPPAIPLHPGISHYGLLEEMQLGILTGAASGFLVVDVDPRHGAEESLAQLEAEGRTLPPTITVGTPKGSHLYYRHPGGLVPSKEHLLPGISICADPSGVSNGWVIVPPSQGVSEYGGGRYVLRRGGPLAEVPEWLLMDGPRKITTNGRTYV